jgi:branched-chain amino acid transport system permease protein
MVDSFELSNSKMPLPGLSDCLQYAFSGLTNGSVYAIVALGLTIVFNASGVVNFAQGGYAVIGALTAVSLVKSSLPLVVAVPGAIVVVGLISCVVYGITVAPLRRPSHFTSISVTLGVSIVLEKIGQFVWGTEFYTLPSFVDAPVINLFGATITMQAVIVLLSSSVLMPALYLFFSHTRAGQAVLACSENRDAAGLVGIHVGQVSRRAYILGSALGAYAGIVILPLTTMNNSAGLFLSLKGFAGCVLGGFGSAVGAVVGGLVLGLLEVFGVGFISSGYQDLIAFAVVILILICRPGGIVGTRTLQQ